MVKYKWIKSGNTKGQKVGFGQLSKCRATNHWLEVRPESPTQFFCQNGFRTPSLVVISRETKRKLNMKALLKVFSKETPLFQHVKVVPGGSGFMQLIAMKDMG